MYEFTSKVLIPDFGHLPSSMPSNVFSPFKRSHVQAGEETLPLQPTPSHPPRETCLLQFHTGFPISTSLLCWEEIPLQYIQRRTFENICESQKKRKTQKVSRKKSKIRRPKDGKVQQQKGERFRARNQKLSQHSYSSSSSQFCVCVCVLLVAGFAYFTRFGSTVHTTDESFLRQTSETKTKPPGIHLYRLLIPGVSSQWSNYKF